MSDATGDADRFKSLLTRLVRVPKSEIDEQEEQRQKQSPEQNHRQPTKAGQIVQLPRKP